MEQEWSPARMAHGVEERRTTEALAWVERAGGGAKFAFEEFLYGQIRNPITRKAYLRAVRVFGIWCEARSLELVRGTPADVAQHLDSIPIAPPTRKLHLAALRRFFDQLVLRHAILLNPALSVRGELAGDAAAGRKTLADSHGRRDGSFNPRRQLYAAVER